MELKELIKECINGSSKAEEIFYKKYYRMLYILAYKNLSNQDIALEIVNDTFISAFKNLNKLIDINGIEKWLNTILINKCIDHHRNNNKKNVDIEDVYDLPNDDTYDKEIFKYQYINEVLGHLTSNERAVFTLAILEEYSHKEIAEILNISETYSRQILFETRKKIIKIINKVNV